jgi:hypothetical protein
MSRPTWTSSGVKITDEETAVFYIVVEVVNIVTYSGLAWLIIMGSGLHDWVYWHFFTVTVSYNSSHIELLLNDICLTNLYEEPRTDLSLL